MLLAPMVCCQTTPDGTVTKEAIKFFEMQAKTGVAYVNIGDTQIDHIHGACYAGELNVTG